VTQALLSLPSYAKLNWDLRVLGRRADGYHELSTFFQSITLHDTIHVRACSGNKVALTCADAELQSAEDNLILRAAGALQARFGINTGADLHLEKRIPLGAGLGGGSSNAAIALLGLSWAWGLHPELSDLTDLARGLGADVPFFLMGGTAWGRGVGDLIDPLEDLSVPYLLVVSPPVRISTAEAYSKLKVGTLTKAESDAILSVSNAVASSECVLPEVLRNDFEPVIFRIEPEVERVRDSLLESGARAALMTGSGSSVFGIFDNREAQRLAYEMLGNEASWRVFVCSTISREDYLNSLGPCAAFLQGNRRD
jgi:4-diphosphocytidyl-2-C-methyl-D-erythritol kinase